MWTEFKGTKDHVITRLARGGRLLSLPVFGVVQRVAKPRRRLLELWLQ